MATGLLIRVGIDSSYGHWNSPVDTLTNRFLYIPIPESHALLSGQRRDYTEMQAPAEDFGTLLPPHLPGRPMHMDPDFEALTYGDGGPRAMPVRALKPGDFVVFFAGLRPLDGAAGVVNAIIGFYEVEHVEPAADVQRRNPSLNAHSRRQDPDDDIVVFGCRRTSGRLKRCLPIAEFRDGAYRVKDDLLREWGGISAAGGFIQRSATLPRFLAPDRFLRWFRRQNPELIRQNNPKPRHFVYKITHDTGLAPCVHDYLWTLAVCKPRIRSAAEPGDWIYGFGGAAYGHKLITVAQVTEKLTGGEYYRRRAYAGRLDSIYEWHGDRLETKKRGEFHAESRDKDIGEHPDYANARVLLSDRFRYRGRDGLPADPTASPRLTQLLNDLRQGHRVNLDREVVTELCALRSELWKEARRVPGEPHDPYPVETCSSKSTTSTKRCSC